MINIDWKTSQTPWRPLETLYNTPLSERSYNLEQVIDHLVPKFSEIGIRVYIYFNTN